MVLGFITNSFGTNAFITNTVTIFGLAIGCHLIMAIVLYVSYFTFGVRVYRHWPAKIGISLFISFYFAFSFVFVFDSINYIFAYGQNFSQ